jgi:hypothetical protein
MRRTTTIATLAAICAALAIASPTAMGKTVKFEGPVNLTYVPSPAGFATAPPTMELKVTFAGKKPKVIPGGTMKAEGLYGLCVFGAYGCSAYPGEAAHCHSVALQKFGDQLKIKNKRFSGTFRELEGAPKDVVDGNFFTVTGRVTKKSVTGTVHARSYQPASPPGTLPVDRPHPAATCDTGVLTWSATR